MTRSRILRRTLPVTALLLLLLAGAAGCRPKGSQPDADQPVAALQSGGIIRVTAQTLAAGRSDTVRLGQLRAGEIAVAQLWLANETDAPIVPADYRTSCGCTTLEFEHQPLRAGLARKITLTFDSHGEWGWQFKRVDLQVAGAERPILLYVEAKVD